MFSNDRGQIRRFFIAAWRKRLEGESLTALESIVADTVARHPEYHPVLGDEETAVASDFAGEHQGTNPFLHMGMHISLQEQLGADRPAGIRDLYRAIAARSVDTHEAEHRMMECLGKILWDAQSRNTTPDEQSYLDCLHRLAGR